MFLAFEMRMLLSLPTTVAIAKAIQLRKGWIIGLDSPPRHFVPGYDQPVPTGQKPFVHRSASQVS